MEVDIENKKWGELIPLITTISSNLIKDYECFKNNLSFDLVKETYHHLASKFTGDRKDCVIKHLKNVVKYVEKAIKALLKGKRDDAKKYFMKALDELKSIEDC